MRVQISFVAERHFFSFYFFIVFLIDKFFEMRARFFYFIFKRQFFRLTACIRRTVQPFVDV